MNVFIIGTAIPGDDPLGLGALSQPLPDAGRLEQDWAAVVAGLEARRRRRRQAWLGGLAAAASVVLVIALLALPRNDTPAPAGKGSSMVEALPADSESPFAGTEASTVAEPTTAKLVAMSQDMERQLRFMREQVGALPTGVLAYEVELQDLIGQLDDTIGLEPDARELWAQRLELQINLMKLYRDELRRDYLRLASL